MNRSEVILACSDAAPRDQSESEKTRCRKTCLRCRVAHKLLKALAGLALDAYSMQSRREKTCSSRFQEFRSFPCGDQWPKTGRNGVGHQVCAYKSLLLPSSRFSLFVLANTPTFFSPYPNTYDEQLIIFLKRCPSGSHYGLCPGAQVRVFPLALNARSWTDIINSYRGEVLLEPGINSGEQILCTWRRSYNTMQVNV